MSKFRLYQCCLPRFKQTLGLLLCGGSAKGSYNMVQYTSTCVVSPSSELTFACQVYVSAACFGCQWHWQCT